MALGSITLREMRPDDLPAVRAIGRRALPLPLNYLMMATVAKTGVVAEDSSATVIGAVTMRHTDIAGRRWGILDWAVVEPTMQGQGIGKALGDRVLPWLADAGCHEVITTDVDGYNSPSWKSAYAQGLRYWPVSAQLRTVGWRWPRLMIAIPHIGISTFLLHRTLREEVPLADPATNAGRGAWLAALLWAIFLLPLSQLRNALWDGGASTDVRALLTPATLLLGAAVMATYMGARALGHLATARSEGVPLAYRFWASGTSFTALLTVAVGGFMPGLLGSFYARDSLYDYRKEVAPIGKVMLGGILSSLALLLLSVATVEFGPAALQPLARLGRGVGTLFALTDLLSFFPPLDALPAGRVWHWKRAVWLLMLLAYGVILVGVPLLA